MSVYDLCYISYANWTISNFFGGSTLPWEIQIVAWIRGGRKWGLNTPAYMIYLLHQFISSNFQGYDHHGEKSGTAPSFLE